MSEDPIANPPTVEFDVGRKLFTDTWQKDPARSVFIDRNADTFAQVLADTWQEDPARAVFVDRNGSTFAQVLDYLRYGSIVLPVTVPKETFLRDLDFYGIVPAEATVRTCSEAWATDVAARYAEIKSLQEEKKRVAEEVDAKILSLELKNDIDILANHVASGHACNLTSVVVCPPSQKGNNKTREEKLWETAKAVHGHENHQVDFQKFLSKFGLQLGEIDTMKNGSYVYYYFKIGTL